MTNHEIFFRGCLENMKSKKMSFRGKLKGIYELGRDGFLDYGLEEFIYTSGLALNQTEVIYI